jgi:diadenosine tetraphosphate (Ap4A) HIT family hydrolase
MLKEKEMNIMPSQSCELCNQIELIKANQHPRLIAELETGYAMLGPSQFFKGYTIFICKVDCPELHLLEKGYRVQMMEELAALSGSVFNAFKPRKLNYECLGNQVPHIHWHIFPRHFDDPHPLIPVWQFDPVYLDPQKYAPTSAESVALKEQILAELRKTSVRIIKTGLE